MAEKSRPSAYLKTRVYRVTKSYVCSFGFVLAWLNLGGLDSSFALSAITVPGWIASGAALLLTTAVALLDALPGDHLKAVLVFWRWKNPLPGARAFEKATFAADHRISVDGLRTHVAAGRFPRSAQDQNATWYRLYKTVQAEPEVAGIHYEYLLFRDLTWFTVVLTLAAILSLATNWHRWRELLSYAGIAAVAAGLFARAGAERGHRLVRTVLAVAAARPTEAKSRSDQQAL